MSFTFGEIKPYLARDMKLSVKMLKGGYTDYFMVSDIPQGKYDDMIIYSLAGEEIPRASPVPTHLKG